MMDKQRTFRYTQHLHGRPETIFPLLCPARERDWLEGWTYEIIHSRAGRAEENCVFKTPQHGREATYWTVSLYEPDRYRIDFVRFTPGKWIVKIAIRLMEKEEGGAAADIAYTYTGLTETQWRRLDTDLPDEFEQSMEWWERSLNHFLKTGEQLRR